MTNQDGFSFGVYDSVNRGLKKGLIRIQCVSCEKHEEMKEGEKWVDRFCENCGNCNWRRYDPSVSNR